MPSKSDAKARTSAGYAELVKRLLPPDGPDPAMLGPFVALHTQAADRMLQHNQEWLRFTADRITCDRALLANLSNPGDPAAIASAWSEFFSGAIDDYSALYRRLWGQYAEEMTAAVFDSQKQAQDFIMTAMQGGGFGEKRHATPV
ncbi:hypothetical protein AXZ77_1763 [Thioclava sp. ES.031]|uniref:hypothetical protein n=1 Tax=Thioclava sp. ES.031 TaxID=1798203 RepID=UPI000BF39C4E|nr:hypothetical protein [Thioclava sp. ES.031]PFG63165.1 hypothetical protein AXZ77_1763 [Thioclava sp. ES.031]